MTTHQMWWRSSKFQTTVYNIYNIIYTHMCIIYIYIYIYILIYFRDLSPKVSLATSTRIQTAEQNQQNHPAVLCFGLLLDCATCWQLPRGSVMVFKRASLKTKASSQSITVKGHYDNQLVLIPRRSSRFQNWRSYGTSGTAAMPLKVTGDRLAIFGWWPLTLHPSSHVFQEPKIVSSENKFLDPQKNSHRWYSSSSYCTPSRLVRISLEFPKHRSKTSGDHVTSVGGLMGVAIKKMFPLTSWNRSDPATNLMINILWIKQTDSSLPSGKLT